MDSQKKCVMCNVILKKDETSVYSCEKCYNKYPFWTISEKKREQMKAEPKFILVNKSTEETMETCDTLKEAIQLLDYNTQYIYDTKNKCKVNHIEY